MRPEMLKTSQRMSRLLGCAVQRRINITDLKVIAISTAMILTTVSLGSTQKASGPKSGPNDVALIGDWHGESICVVKPSACHDEESLYHVSPVPQKPGAFSLKADKIVDGRPVYMGKVQCSYDRATYMLLCDFERGVFQFLVKGSEMRGAMKLKDGTLWRKISLKKTN